MAYDSHFTGRIDITPPLTWAQIKNSRSSGLQDLRLDTVEIVEDTDSGRATTITGNAIIPLTTSLYSGYAIEDEFQSVVDAFPAHDFSGHIEARPEDPEGEPWRYVVVDRRVVRRTPRLTWPTDGPAACGRGDHAGMDARTHLEGHLHWGCVSNTQMASLIDALLAQAGGQPEETAGDELRDAKEAVRSALLRGVKGLHAAERADCLLDRYQQALKAALHEQHANAERKGQ